MIIQIQNSGPALGKEEEKIVGQMKTLGMEVIISDGKDSICDPALKAAMSRVLVFTDPILADKIDNDDILLVWLAQPDHVTLEKASDWSRQIMCILNPDWSR